MKPRILTCITAITFATLALPVRLTAQDGTAQANKPKHHHYQLIDLGTFGGPNSWFDSLSLSDGLGFDTVSYNNAVIGNAQGVFVGFADTSTPDPYPGFCYVPDCFETRAFQSI